MPHDPIAATLALLKPDDMFPAWGIVQLKEQRGMNSAQETDEWRRIFARSAEATKSPRFWTARVGGALPQYGGEVCPPVAAVGNPVRPPRSSFG